MSAEKLQELLKKFGGDLKLPPAPTWVYPPPATPGCTNAVVRVRLQPYEKIQWHYAHTQKGSFVTGYEIIP